MSNYAKSLKKGTSTSFFGGSIDPKILSDIKKAGIDCIELSAKYEKLVHDMCFLENAPKIGQMVSDAGLELWSVHLPFGGVYDTSLLRDFERDYAISVDEHIIKAAAKAGAKVCVIHATSGMFDHEEYLKRLPRANDAIIRLSNVADKVGITLAVENQPMSIPTRYPEYMAKILKDSCAKMCYDANHCVYINGIKYLEGIRDLGIEVATLHLSDYDYINERHRMPGDGINDWNALLAHLESINYSGPLMYEVTKQPKDRECSYTIEQISENMTKLVNGML